MLPAVAAGAGLRAGLRARPLHGLPAAGLGPQGRGCIPGSPRLVSEGRRDGAGDTGWAGPEQDPACFCSRLGKAAFTGALRAVPWFSFPYLRGPSLSLKEQ